jgi:hypothetical protein
LVVWLFGPRRGTTVNKKTTLFFVGSQGENRFENSLGFLLQIEDLHVIFCSLKKNLKTTFQEGNDTSGC